MCAHTNCEKRNVCYLPIPSVIFCSGSSGNNQINQLKKGRCTQLLPLSSSAASSRTMPVHGEHSVKKAK